MPAILNCADLERFIKEEITKIPDLPVLRRWVDGARAKELARLPFTETVRAETDDPNLEIKALEQFFGEPEPDVIHNQCC